MSQTPQAPSLAEAQGLLGTPLSPAQVAQLETYRAALQTSVHNVTALSDDGIVRDLIVDALAGVAVLGAIDGPVIDVGTGGGVPGLPLAVAFPERRFVLLDSNAKKMGFVQSVAEAMGLSNVETACTRVEDAGRAPSLREQHGAAVAKAVAPLRVLVEWLVPLVRPEGRVVVWKGPAADAEIADAAGALQALGAEVEQVVPYQLIGRERRVLVVIRRVAPLDARFPRPVGRATKRPL